MGDNMKAENFEDLIDLWQVEKHNFSENAITDLLPVHRKKTFWNYRTLYAGIAACLIIAVGVFLFANLKSKDTNVIFDGSNSDYACYTILMDVNYEK